MQARGGTDLTPRATRAPYSAAMDTMSRLALLVAALAAALVPASAQAVPAAPAAPAAPPRPRVAILATGGTIAGSGASSTTTVGYKAATAPVEQLVAALPELREAADVRAEQVFQLASENITPAHWLALARRAGELLARPDVDGVVVTHGTDTLEETAYFLDLVLKSEKPVVLVGAMRPPTALSADGPLNLYNAVRLAGVPEARGRGVLVCLNDEINAARDATKTNRGTLGTFRAPELGFLGYMVGGKPVFLRATARRHTTSSEFDVAGLDALPRVEIVTAYAGAGRWAVDAAIAAGAKGIVFAGVGNGSVPLDARPALAEARRRGIVVVRSSRVPEGVVARNGEVDDDAFDFVAGGALSPQKARVLLTLALTKTTDAREVQRIFDEY